MSRTYSTSDLRFGQVWRFETNPWGVMLIARLSNGEWKGMALNGTNLVLSWGFEHIMEHWERLDDDEDDRHGV